MYVFVDKRCLFKPLSFKLCSPLKPVSLWVNLACSLFLFPIHCVSYYFLWKWGISKPAFWIFGGEIQNRGKTIFNVGDQNMMKLWYRSKEILINKVFFFYLGFLSRTFDRAAVEGGDYFIHLFLSTTSTSSHKENIHKIKETINPIVDTKKLWAKIYYHKVAEIAQKIIQK